MKLKGCFLHAAASVGVLLLASQTASALESGSIRGTVTSVSGKPVAGAFVRVYCPETRLTFMVISRSGGRYDASDLPVGTYVVEGIGGDYQSKLSGPVTVSDDRATDVDVPLTEQRGPALAHAMPNSLPTSEMAKLRKQHTFTLPEGPGKDLVQTRCTTCHTLGRVVLGRKDLEDWQSTVSEMRDNMTAAHLPANLTLTDEQAGIVGAYLAKNFRPVALDVNSRLPYDLLTGKERDYRVITYLMLPHLSQPHDIAVAPDGVAWASQRGGMATRNGALVRFDPRTLEVTSWYAPPGSSTLPSSTAGRWLGNPQISAQGILWTTDEPNQRWLSFNTHTLEWKAYPVPAGHFAGANSMAIAKNGLIWGSNEDHVRSGAYSLNPKTGEWHFYYSHLLHSGGYGLTIAGDGTVWFAEDGADRMGHVFPETGKEVDLPIPLKGRLYPRRMATDAEGNVWVGLWQAGKLMKIDNKTGKMTFFTPPTKVPGCYSVAVDLKRDIIWVSEQQADKIARFDPKTGSWLEFPLAVAQSDDRRISFSQAYPNRIFFSGDTSDLIGFIEYDPPR